MIELAAIIVSAWVLLFTLLFTLSVMARICGAVAPRKRRKPPTDSRSKQT